MYKVFPRNLYSTECHTYTCWDCRCLMALCCGVSCLVTVITSRFIGIDLFIGGRHTHTWGSGLLGNSMMPCDVIRVYAKMNWNFKGGMNNVMIKYNDTVDSRRLQQCAVDNHSSLAHTSAHAKPIRRRGGSVMWILRFLTLIGCTGARCVSSRSGTSGSAI